MRFELLGQLRVADEAGEPVEVPGTRLRVLLAALVLRANTPVGVEALIEEVWDGAPPTAAARTLSSHVGRLRRALGVEAGRVVTHDPGYLLRVRRGELDASGFEACCREAGSALRETAWARTSDVAARALALWRGQPLLDVPSQLLRDRFAPRLEQLWLQVLEDHAEAELHLGRCELLVPQLRELTGVHPLREHFHVQLMTALADSGRRAEALEAYRHARQVLVEELGVEPGPELRRLHERILAGDEAPPPAPPAPPSTDQAPPAPAAVVRSPHQLPAAPGYFVGRKAELELLTELPTDSEITAGIDGTTVICAVDGMAGIGKTALAVHAAHVLADRYPDGQLFLDLHGHTAGRPPREPGEALEWFLRALGIPAQQIPEDTEARAALHRHRLADTRTLILLDNATDEAQVRPLLPGDPGCLVLVTSRRRLKGLDDARSVSLGLLKPHDAIALLRHRPIWNLQHLAGLLRDEPRRLQALFDGERSLVVVFDLSYTSLRERHQLLFRCMGLVPGPDVDAYAAAALLDTDSTTATGLLEDLVDHNLLIEHAPGRYRLHDLIRAHARTLAERDPAPARNAAADRLLHYYGHTARSASVPIARYPRAKPDDPAPAHAPGLSDPEAARAWLRTERDNLEAAIAHARVSALHEHLIELAAGLAEILRIDGPLSRALDLHQAAAETAERQGRTPAQAIALNDLGTVRRLTGDLPGATDALNQALEICHTTGSHHGKANALAELGYVRRLAGDLPEATDALAQALESYRLIGNRHGEANALTELALVRRLTGDLSGAAGALTQALENSRMIGHRNGEAAALTELGIVWRITGDLPGADAALTQALDISRETGHGSGEAYVLTELGLVRRLTGDLPRAFDALIRVLDIYRATGNRHGEAWALNHYAAAVAVGGDLPRALALYRQALAMNRGLDKPDDEAVALEGLGECLGAAGEIEPALAHLRQALEIFQNLGMAPDIERVRTRLAELSAR
jgi:DNA-binding SARP family transcriptional activator